MPVIVLQGERKQYLFSVVEANYDDMPSWGGIYIAVNATRLGIDMQNCVAIGACDNFKEYAEKIKNFVFGRCTHLYLLPEFEQVNRKIALEDLMSTEAFSDVTVQVIKDDSVEDAHQKTS